MKKIAFLLLCLMALPLQPLTAADTSEENTTEENDYSSLSSNLECITKHLNKLNSLFKSKPDKATAVLKQSRKAKKYLDSAAAKKAQTLILEGFPCPPKEAMSPTTAKQVSKTLSSMEKFRKTLAKLQHHLNNNFSNCEVASISMEVEENVRTAFELADGDYEILYETLHAEDKKGPELEEYKK